jgi:hypothetical protein
LTISIAGSLGTAINEASGPFGRSFTDEKHLIPLIKSLFGFTGQISP